jgi:putative transposase
VSAFIEEHRERFGVEPICETLGVSASAYYQRASGRRSARAREDERLLDAIRELHERNYLAYGSRRGPDPSAMRSPDLVQRDFQASRPDELWFADFTYLRCWEGLVFFSFVIDAYSRKVVGWQFASHMRTTLVLDALAMALHQRAPGADVALVHHSDAGSRYTSIDYNQTLDDHGVLGSIGSVGDAYDNARAESFVDSFKTELIADRVWMSRSQLELAVVEYVAWFNNERLHEALGDRPPREIEELYAVKARPTTPIR